MTALAPLTSPAAQRPRLRAVHDRPPVDLDAAERAVADLLVALGKAPDSEHLVDTPRRVARSYAELLTPRTVTSAVRGLLRDDPRSRQEFFALTRVTA